MEKSKSLKLKYDKVSQKAWEELLNFTNYLSKEELSLLVKAYDFAYKAHDKQFRISKEPYITHPIAVAKELAKWKVDIYTLQAALLHDVLEDTGKNKDQLQEEFGSTVSEIVDGVSKLEKFDCNNYIEHQAQSFKKMILAMVKDLRVLLIKLSDRLHNMKTLDVMRLDKRLRIAKETMEVYVLLADRIGMSKLSRELQDLSFKYIKPNRYRVLYNEINKLKSTRQIIIDKISKEFLHQLFLFNIESIITIREKNIYNIYLELSKRKYKFVEIMNIYRFTIIVNSIQDCYKALGAIHSLYKPRPGKFEDYIAIPKNNGHQGLKTILINNIGNNIEVVLMTKEMEQVSTFGMITNWLNKKSFYATSIDTIQKSKNEWLKNLMDIQSYSDNAIDFFESVKKDLSYKEVYIFTPKGKIIILPLGATPIDFAYAIHTDLGHNCTGALVDNVSVPLRYQLSSGQKVEILTRQNGNPNPAWISFIVSARAKSAIRNKIKDMRRQDAINLGEQLLNQVLESLLPKDIILSEDIKENYLLSLYNNKSFDEILYEIGIGRLLPVTVVVKIFELAGKNFGYNGIKLNPIIVSNKVKSNIKLATCCNPIPGDKIKALIIKDQGLVIHRENCANILKAGPHHVFEADLDCINNNTFYNVKLIVNSKDYKGLLLNITSCITLHNANIVMVETPSNKKSGFDGFIEFLFEIQLIGGLDKLNKIIQLIASIPQVNKVSRL